MLTKISRKLLGKKLSCKLSLHDWKVIKSIRLSNIVFLIKKHSELLKKVDYQLDDDFVVYDKKCKICSKEDLNIDITKELIIKKMKNLLKAKN